MDEGELQIQIIRSLQFADVFGRSCSEIWQAQPRNFLFRHETELFESQQQRPSQLPRASNLCLSGRVMSQTTRSLRSLFVRGTKAAIPQFRQARTFSFLTCRQHEQLIQQRKEAIRQRIQDLELSRRKFSLSSIQSHGHLDPPKPGEE